MSPQEDPGAPEYDQNTGSPGLQEELSEEDETYREVSLFDFS